MTYMTVSHHCTAAAVWNVSTSQQLQGYHFVSVTVDPQMREYTPISVPPLDWGGWQKRRPLYLQLVLELEAPI